VREQKRVFHASENVLTKDPEIPKFQFSIEKKLKKEFSLPI